MKKIAETHLRMQHRAIQLNRFRTQATLRASAPVPRVLDVIAPDNLLSRETMYSGLNIEIDQWESIYDGDTILLEWNGNSVESHAINDVEEETWPIRLTVPSAALRATVDGTYELYYTLQRESGAEIKSNRVSVRIDTRIPNRDKSPDALILPTDIISAEYLASNNDEVIATVPGYLDMEEGQTVSVFWEGTPVPAVTVSAEDIEDNQIQVHISGDIIREVGEGKIITYYVLTSRADFEGRHSHQSSVNVLLQPIPNNLPAPFVPLAEDELLTLSDADAGVTVEINAYLNAATGDFIRASWGGEDLPQATVQANAFPLEIAVPRQIVLKVGSQHDVPVKYRVVRSGAEFPSPVTEVNVDVDYVGPTDPDTSTVVNEALIAPTVKGKSNTENKLVPGDTGEPVTVTVPFYAKAAEGQIVSLHWGMGDDQPSQEYTLTAEDITAENIPDFSIDADYIVENTPNGTDFPVFYTLSRASDNPPPNPVRSMTQRVDVTMNSPRNLPEVELPGVNAKGWLLYGQVKDGCEVNIPVYEGMELKDTVQLKWQAYSKTNAADGTELENTFWQSDTVTVTAKELANGLSFLVPYENYIEPIATVKNWSGAGKINYVVEQRGSSYAGPERIVKIDLIEGPDTSI